MDGQSRMSPTSHQKFFLGIVNQIADDADIFLVFIQIEVDWLIKLSFLFGHWGNIIIDPRDLQRSSHFLGNNYLSYQNMTIRFHKSG